MAASKEMIPNVKSSPETEIGQVKSTSIFDRLKLQKIDLNEVGKELFEQSLQYDQDQLERDSIKVRRKLDFLVLPMVSSRMSILNKRY